MAANSEFKRVGVGDRWQGFSNLFWKENRMWWRTSRWWKQVLVWMVLVNGLLYIAFQGGGKNIDGSGMPPEALALSGLSGFLGIVGMLVPAGVVLLADDTLLDEKRQGTAAWVLSKPVTRPALILSKLVSYDIGILVTLVVVQAAAAFGMMRALSGVMPPIAPFVRAMGIVYLGLVFWLTLTVMLSAISNSRGLVLGLPLLLIFAPVILGNMGIVPAWAWDILPWNLTYPAGTIRPSLTDSLLMGLPVASWVPAIATVVWCVIFTAVAIWAFKREEF